MLKKKRLGRVVTPEGWSLVGSGQVPRHEMRGTSGLLLPWRCLWLGEDGWPPSPPWLRAQLQNAAPRRGLPSVRGWLQYLQYIVRGLCCTWKQWLHPTPTSWLWNPDRSTMRPPPGLTDLQLHVGLCEPDGPRGRRTGLAVGRLGSKSGLRFMLVPCSWVDKGQAQPEWHLVLEQHAEELGLGWSPASAVRQCSWARSRCVSVNTFYGLVFFPLATLCGLRQTTWLSVSAFLVLKWEQLRGYLGFLQTLTACYFMMIFFEGGLPPSVF